MSLFWLLISKEGNYRNTDVTWQYHEHGDSMRLAYEGRPGWSSAVFLVGYIMAVLVLAPVLHR